ncbi:MAG: amidohydrolase family protein [Candidatus Pristimantibacillus sp.]
MKYGEHRKDGNRKWFRLFGLFAVIIIALYPGWYRSNGNEDGDKGSHGSEPAQLALQQWSEAELTKTYDTVIAGGRVMNPETKLDEKGWNVGISEGKIAIVTPKPLQGKRTIDASGLVVAPGFIDNLSYDPNPLGVWQKIADGVTTNIAMHGGTAEPAKWYSYYERNETPLHFGASFFYTHARNQFRLGRYDSAQPDQVGLLVQDAERALNEGALGISFSLEYVPGISAAEIIPLMELAQEYNVPVYFHARYSDMEEPGTNLDAVNELIGYAEKTGAAVHIDHINSTGGTFSMEQSLALIDEARKKGLDLTACVYPYDYWGTYLNSARFDTGWQSRFRISFPDLQIAGTMERLTEQTFTRYRSEGKLAVAYAIPEQDVVDALKASYVMIGSDAILEPGLNNHPRASGTFARTVGLYVREKRVMSLMDAIAKMSLLPAQRLEKQAPALRQKGRLAKGMDADIVIFDEATIIDRSTVDSPGRLSGGIRYVFINGKAVMDNGKLNKKQRVGQPIRSKFIRITDEVEQIRWGQVKHASVIYNGVHYMDINSLMEHGYSLSWDPTMHVYTAVEGASVSRNGKDSVPVVGELMLERGYQVDVNGVRASLLSIGKRDFIPIPLLKQLGFKVENKGDEWMIN